MTLEKRRSLFGRLTALEGRHRHSIHEDWVEAMAKAERGEKVEWPEPGQADHAALAALGNRTERNSQ